MTKSGFSREQIEELMAWYTTEDKDIMSTICEKAPYSPMCNNTELLEDLIKVSSSRGVDYKLLLWIMYAESHIWMAFKPGNCWVSNNRAGLKARKFDDWSISMKFNEQYKTLSYELQAQLNGCRLYYFEDIHTFFESLSNTIWVWYKVCNWEPECIVTKYVWRYSENRINNVNTFNKLNDN